MNAKKTTPCKFFHNGYTGIVLADGSIQWAGMVFELGAAHGCLLDAIKTGMARAEGRRPALSESLDIMTRRHTAFGSFKEMVMTAFGSHYRPTLYVYAAKDPAERRALKFLADYYDRAMQCLCQDRRAYRC